MKKIIRIGLLLSLFLCSISLGVTQRDLQLLRNVGDGNSQDAETVAAVLTALKTAGDFANMPSGALKLPSNLENLQLYFLAGQADANTFDFVIEAWRADNGPADLIGYGTCTLGSQAVVKYPENGTTATTKFWADTIVIDSNNTSTFGWINTIHVSNSANDGLSDGVASLTVNLAGYKYVWVYIVTANNSSTEAGYIRVYWSYYDD